MGRKILVAVELDDASANTVLRKARDLATDDDTLSVVHVIFPADVGYSPDPTMTGAMYQQTHDVAMENAARRLRSLSTPYGIEPLHCHVRYGRIAHEIHTLIHEQGFDTLMIGSHGWSGWRRLLGSQANSILHGVPVDTWVFKVGEVKTP